MNTSPWLEIIVGVAIFLFFLGLFLRYLYKKKHHIHTCACGKSFKSKEQLLKEYRKCCCDKK